MLPWRDSLRGTLLQCSWDQTLHELLYIKLLNKEDGEVTADGQNAIFLFAYVIENIEKVSMRKLQYKPESK